MQKAVAGEPGCLDQSKLPCGLIKRHRWTDRQAKHTDDAQPGKRDIAWVGWQEASDGSPASPRKLLLLRDRP